MIVYLSVGAALVALLIAIWSTIRSIEALERPFLIPSVSVKSGWRLEWSRDEKHDVERLMIPMLNVGKGTAMLGDVQLTVDGRQLISQPGGQIAMPPQEPGGGPYVNPFQLAGGVERPAGDDVEGVLTIYYAHASGKRYMTRGNVRVGKHGVHATTFRRFSSDRLERDFLFQRERYPPLRMSSLGAAIQLRFGKIKRGWR